MNQPDAERAWLRLARRSARKVNVAWWLQSWAPLAVFAGLLGFTSIFYLRSTGFEIDAERAWPWLAAGGAVACALAAWLARGNYTGRESALVRLESKLGLNNALTAARRGVAPWPELPARTGDGLAWRPAWLIAPPLVAIALLATSLFIPVSPPEQREQVAPPEPGAWARVESAIDRLEENDLAEPEDLARIRDQVQQLRATPEGEWFSADTLEASASLEGAFGAGLARMGNDLARADHNLGQLAKFGEQMSARAKARAAEDFAAAAKNLETGKLKPNQALRDQLKNIDPRALDGLTPEQLQQLRERLQQNADALRRIAGRAGAEESPFEDEQPDGAGDGGVDEGPGHPPLQLADEPSDLGTDQPEGIASNELERAAAGDLLEELDGGHEIDRSEVGPRAGGAIASPGGGGDTVTRNQLLPSEKAVLRRYFE